MNTRAAVSVSRGWAFDGARRWIGRCRTHGLAPTDPSPSLRWSSVNAPLIFIVLVYQAFVRERSDWGCCFVPGCSDFAVGCLRRLPPWHALPAIRARIRGCNGSSFGVATLTVRCEDDDRAAFEHRLEQMTMLHRSSPPGA